MRFNSSKHPKKLQASSVNENQFTVLAEGFDEQISYKEVAKKKDVVQVDENLDLILIKLNHKIDLVGIRLEKSIADLGIKLTTFICASSFSVMTILLAFMMFLHSGK
jgi:hypothetical protein